MKPKVRQLSISQYKFITIILDLPVQHMSILTSVSRVVCNSSRLPIFNTKITIIA